MTVKALRSVAFGVLALSLAVLGAIGLQALRGQPEIAFEAHETLPGFRRLQLASGSGDIDVLAGVGRGGPPLPDEDVCAALATPGVMPVLGPAEAPVRVVSFSDYRCPHCRVLSPVLLDLAERGAIRLVMQEWPVFGPASMLAARAAIAADRQGGYAAFHHRLMRTAFAFNDAFLLAVAGEVGLDPDRLRADMEDPAITTGIGQAEALAHALGLRGTPSLVVGRTIVEGAVDPALLRRLIVYEAEDPGNACPATG